MSSTQTPSGFISSISTMNTKGGEEDTYIEEMGDVAAGRRERRARIEKAILLVMSEWFKYTMICWLHMRSQRESQEVTHGRSMKISEPR